jgi:hypothetical protein
MSLHVVLKGSHQINAIVVKKYFPLKKDAYKKYGFLAFSMEI